MNRDAASPGRFEIRRLRSGRKSTRRPVKIAFRADTRHAGRTATVVED